MSKLRTVVAYAGGSADYVLFDCGHTVVASAVGGRKPYPPRRLCFRCPREEPVPVDIKRFFDEHKGARLAPTDEERVAYAERKARWALEMAEAHARNEVRREIEHERAESKRELLAEAVRWRNDELATGNAFCAEECEHHECRLARAVARYEAG